MTSTSPRIEPLHESAWSDEHRSALAHNGISGEPDPLIGALLHVPEMLDAITPMTRYVTEQSTLGPAQRELLARRVAWLDGRGGRVDEIEPGESGDHELVQLADQLVLTSAVTDATWDELAAHHDTHWMMDAVETVAHHSFLCCLANAFLGHAAQDSGAPRRPRPPDRPGKPAHARIDPLPGDDIAVHRTFARHPAMNEARRPRPRFVNHVSTLTPHDRETLILRIGWDCRSEYEWAKHVGTVGHAREHGVDPALVVAGPTAGLVTEHDALLMQVADDLAQDSTVGDTTWHELVARHDRRAAMSVVFSAASYRATCMSLNAYGVQLEPGDEGFPVHR